MVYLPAVFVVTSVLLVALLRWVPLKYTPLMLRRSVESGSAIKPIQKWVSLDEVSQEMICAVICSEDARFFQHQGFDYYEIRKEIREYRSYSSEQGGEKRHLRGCSTISQQTAKNCFTFCGRSWFRKAIETYYTVLIEKIWGKERILEVYLNVIETGPAMFGIEAASMAYYRLPPSQLNTVEAASIACCLPDPLHRNPMWVNVNMPGRISALAENSLALGHKNMPPLTPKRAALTK